MDDDQRAELRAAQERLASVSVLLRARRRLEDVARLTVTSTSDEELIAQLSQLLGCTEDQARHVMSTPLRMYRRGDSLEGEVAELEIYLGIS